MMILGSIPGMAKHIYLFKTSRPALKGKGTVIPLQA